MLKYGKEEGYFYLEQRIVDSKQNIIVDVYVIPRNKNDIDLYLARLYIKREKFGFDIKYVGLDNSYCTNLIFEGIANIKLTSTILTILGPHDKGKCTKDKFIYANEWDVYECPNNYFLKYRNTTRQGYTICWRHGLLQQL